MNQKVFFVFAEPMRMTNKEEVAKKLAKFLQLDEKELIDKFTRRENDLYEPVKHFITDKEVVEIKSWNLAGIKFQDETKRYYPEKNIFSHLTGFVSIKDEAQEVGQYGLEGYFEKNLGGEAGYLKSERDPIGRFIPLTKHSVQEAVNGDNLILTIDYTAQYETCKVLTDAVKKHGADKGSAIVMEPQTGKIIAMCNYPDFDPNNYNKVEDIKVFTNTAIFEAYEPGSVFKPVTMAGAVDAGSVTPDTTYTDPGVEKIGGFEIKNFDDKNHGVNTMTQVLENSLNTGVIFAMRKMGANTFEDYVKKFGFGLKTGIDLSGESAGNISSFDQKGEIYPATASFGQGISVTPLQMINAINAIANQGKLMKPYIVEEIDKIDGTKIKHEPEVIRQVISPRAATLVSGMMVSVVENGHAKRAAVAGYYVAGKTGTAQVAGENGGYSKKTVHTFVGFVPVDHPRFTMLIRIDDPKDVQFAEGSSVPVFGEVANFLVKYYDIPMERKINPKP
jgi:cell division protein FtsI/penicillin-binding protein 2